MMTPEEAQTLNSLASATESAGANAATTARAQDAFESAAKDSIDPKAYKDHSDGAFESALLSHNVLAGLLQVAAEELRDKPK